MMTSTERTIKFAKPPPINETTALQIFDDTKALRTENEYVFEELVGREPPPAVNITEKPAGTTPSSISENTVPPLKEPDVEVINNSAKAFEAVDDEVEVTTHVDEGRQVNNDNIPFRLTQKNQLDFATQNTQLN